MKKFLFVVSVFVLAGCGSVESEVGTPETQPMRTVAQAAVVTDADGNPLCPDTCSCGKGSSATTQCGWQFGRTWDGIGYMTPKGCWTNGVTCESADSVMCTESCTNCISGQSYTGAQKAILCTG
ncbi:hypothetical protein [Melittangium boletus]|uniref:hypothetical protein n=1 Tax=Melittangium boletus TaxID=83453 RepID=UPI003DA5A113